MPMQAQELYLNDKAQLPISVPGLLAVLGTEGFVHSLVADLLDSQVVASITCTHGVKCH